MRSLFIILIVSSLNAANVMMAWDIKNQEWVNIWIENGKKTICNKNKKCTDVTKRIYITDLSAGSVHILKRGK